MPETGRLLLLHESCCLLMDGSIVACIKNAKKSLDRGVLDPTVSSTLRSALYSVLCIPHPTPFSLVQCSVVTWYICTFSAYILYILYACAHLYSCSLSLGILLTLWYREYSVHDIRYTTSSGTMHMSTPREKVKKSMKSGDGDDDKRPIDFGPTVRIYGITVPYWMHLQ